MLTNMEEMWQLVVVADTEKMLQDKERKTMVCVQTVSCEEAEIIK